MSNRKGNTLTKLPLKRFQRGYRCFGVFGAEHTAAGHQYIGAGLKQGFGIDIPQPFPRFDYEEAMAQYGCDKPDLRFDMKLIDCTDLARRSAFKVFQGAVEVGGIVKGLCAKGAAEKFSRKGIDELLAFVNGLGAKGLAWAKVGADGLSGSIAKFLHSFQIAWLDQDVAGKSQALA